MKEMILPPGLRTGEITIPSSKSQAHRLLICAALGKSPVTVQIRGFSRDILATMHCLKALGAEITQEGELLHLEPISHVPSSQCILPCGESGSTLRFLLPIAGALGASAVFEMEGRLPQRPLEPLSGLLKAQGMKIEQRGTRLFCSGQLQAGQYTLPGNISSQYISGLLMALPLLYQQSTLTVTGNVESSAYITMTENALALGGVNIQKQGFSYTIPGNQRGNFPSLLCAEGDYSNAAFFLCMGAFSQNGITVRGLDPSSAQGDRAVLQQLASLGAKVSVKGDSVTVSQGNLCGCTIDAAPIPDLIPVLSVMAAASRGKTEIIHAGRLRLKESDRLSSSAAMLRALGANVKELPEGLIIEGVSALHGGRVDCCGDHRIAMSAAVAACISQTPVTINDCECTGKSYPDFWQHYTSLKGDVPV